MPRLLTVLSLALFSLPALAQDAEVEAVPLVEQQPAPQSTEHVQASLVIKVPNRDAAAQELIDKTEALGGWFSGVSQESVDLRVPAAQINTLMDFAVEQGVVVNRSFNSQDLGSQIIDTRARLEAREKILADYFAILPGAKAGAVLNVEREIVRVVAEIEGLKGSLRAMEHRAEWAELSVSFQFRERQAPSRDGSSSFAWLNTLNLADLMQAFRYQHVDYRGPGVGLGELEPEGFSAYRKLRHERWAVSPDEVVIRARAAKHRPKADLPFWREATLERMKAAGYRVLRSEEIQVGAQPGFMLEFTAPLGTDDYTYLVAVVPKGRKLIVVEAAGEVSRYEARREAIVAAVKGL